MREDLPSGTFAFLFTDVAGSTKLVQEHGEPDRLRAALEREQIQTGRANQHALLAHGTSSDRVGQIAFTAGVPLYGLVAGNSSLENVFLQLTSQEQP